MTSSGSEGPPVPINELSMPQIHDASLANDEIDLTLISEGRVFGLYAADGITDSMFRIRKGRKLGRQNRGTLRRFISLAEEAAFTDQFKEQVVDPMDQVARGVKRDFGKLSRETGVDGVFNIEGNYNATFVPSAPSVRKDPEAIYKSLDSDLRRGVVARDSTITIFLGGDELRTKEGNVDATTIYRGVVNLLRDNGASRSAAYSRVRRGVFYRLVSGKRLEALRREGLVPEGITVTDKSRVEVDPVRDHEGIHVQRPASIDERLRALETNRADREELPAQESPPVL